MREFRGLNQVFNKICDFFEKLFEWTIAAVFCTLLGFGAIYGISSIYNACGVSSDVLNIVLSIITCAFIAFLIYILTKVHSNKKVRVFFHGLNQVFNKICDFFEKLFEWIISGFFYALLGFGAIYGVSLIYNACGVSSDVLNIILSIITCAFVVFIIYILTKVHSNKKMRERDAHVTTWYASDSDGMTERERFEQNNYLNAARHVDEIRRDLDHLETQRSQITEQEYSRRKSELEGRLGVWQDATDLSHRLWQEEAYK